MVTHKGVVEVQMNWILVGIIGAIIILFFVGIVARQRVISEESHITQIIQKLDDIFTSSRAASGGVTEIVVPAAEIRFLCDEYRIGTQRHFLESDILFAPEWIGDSEQRLIVWSLTWKLPYPVTNFLYVTAPQIKYVFVYDDPKFDSFYDLTMTDKINKEHRRLHGDLLLKDMADENNYKIKFVIFAEPQTITMPRFILTKEYDVDIVFIEDFDPNVKIPSGTVKYFSYDKKTDTISQTGQSSYIGNPSLIGAIFSDDAENYACGMKKALGALYGVSSVYEKKVELLDKTQVCPVFYDEAEQQWISVLKGLSGQPDLWEEHITDFVRGAEELQQRNNLIESQSCPLLY